MDAAVSAVGYLFGSTIGFVTVLIVLTLGPIWDLSERYTTPKSTTLKIACHVPKVSPSVEEIPVLRHVYGSLPIFTKSIAVMIAALIVFVISAALYMAADMGVSPYDAVGFIIANKLEVWDCSKWTTKIVY